MLLIFYMTLISSTIVFGDTLTYTLRNGAQIPAVALGTSLGRLSNGTRILSVNHTVARAVQWALEAGYRHIDTASLYQTEDEIGRGIQDFMKSNQEVSRGEVFVTTKLWNDMHSRDDVIPALQASLAALQLSYVDLYLIHFPMAYNKDGSISNTDYLETWDGMELAKAKNLTRSIGVSNFNIKQLKRLYQHAKIKPDVLQIEVNPSITQNELVDWCKDHDIVVMAYSPFGAILGRKNDAPGPRSNHTVFQELTKKYNKSVPQILLRYLIDRQLVAIPRSTNKQRIEENINIFDFSLSPEEIKSLNEMNVNYELRAYVDWYDHPHFPFEKKNIPKI